MSNETNETKPPTNPLESTFLVLIRSRAFLVAAWAMARALTSWLAPNVPGPVLAALDSLAAVTIATVAIAEARSDAHMARAFRLSEETGAPVDLGDGVEVRATDQGFRG